MFSFPRLPLPRAFTASEIKYMNSYSGLQLSAGSLCLMPLYGVWKRNNASQLQKAWLLRDEEITRWLKAKKAFLTSCQWTLYWLYGKLDIWNGAPKSSYKWTLQRFLWSSFPEPVSCTVRLCLTAWCGSAVVSVTTCKPCRKLLITSRFDVSQRLPERREIQQFGFCHDVFLSLHSCKSAATKYKRDQKVQQILEGSHKWKAS